MSVPRAWLLLAALLGAVPAGCNRQTNPDFILFGHLAPAGDNAQVRGIDLAVDEVNADPARYLLGRKVKVIHADGGDSPNDYQAQANRLAAVDRVQGLLGGGKAEYASRVGQVAQALQVLAVSTAGTSARPAVTLLFPVGVAPSEQGKFLARYARQELKLTGATVVRDARSPTAPAVAEAFAREFRAGDKATVQEINHGVAESVPAAAKRIVGGKPAAVVLAATGKDALEWVNELRQAKLPADTPVVFAGEPGELPALQADPERSQGLYAVTGFVADDDSPRAKAFVENYRKRFNRSPPPAAAMAHDAFTVLTESVRRAQTLQAGRLREEIMRPGAPGFDVLTGTLSYAPDQTARRPVFVVRLDKGEPKRQKRYEPEQPEKAPAAKE